MNMVRFLVLRSGYVESNDSRVLILFKRDKSSFDPDAAANQLVSIVETSVSSQYEIKFFDCDEEQICNFIHDAYWGTADDTGLNYDEMDRYGWDHYTFPSSINDCHPSSINDCHIVEEKAPEWMFACWEKKNANWYVKPVLSEKDEALNKLSDKDKRALGL